MVLAAAVITLTASRVITLMDAKKSSALLYSHCARWHKFVRLGRLEHLCLTCVPEPWNGRRVSEGIAPPLSPVRLSSIVRVVAQQLLHRRSSLRPQS